MKQLILVTMLAVLTACAPSASSIETAIAQTEAANPTATKASTNTKAPTATRKPTATKAPRNTTRFVFAVGTCRSYTDLHDRDPQDVGCIESGREIIALGP